MSGEAAAQARLLAAQRELLAAVQQGGTLPGFPADGMRTIGAAALAKRARLCAEAWRPLVHGLGGARFLELFTAYAAGTPLPPAGDGLTDGRDFAAYLRRRGMLPDAGRVRAAAFDVRFRRRPGVAIPRRAPAVRMCLLRRPPALVVAVYAPPRWSRGIRIPLSFVVRGATVAKGV
jgi:hypothetical protein